MLPVRSRVALFAAFLAFVTLSCSSSSSPTEISSDAQAVPESQSSATTVVPTTSTTQAATTSTSVTVATTSVTTAPIARPSAATFPTEDYDVETRITAFAGLTDGYVGVFRPVGNRQVMAATTSSDSVVGYVVDESGGVAAVGVYVPLSDSSQVAIPARLLGIVASSAVDPDDALEAADYFRIDVLPQLTELGAYAEYADDRYFRLVVAVNEGLVFAFSPPGNGPDYVQELGALAELAE